MINIQLTENWKLTTDPHNYILSRRYFSEKHQEYEWKPKAYHRTLPDALGSVCEHLIKESDVTSFEELKTLLDANNSLIRDIKEMLTKSKEV